MMNNSKEMSTNRSVTVKNEQSNLGSQITWKGRESKTENNLMTV